MVLDGVVDPRRVISGAVARFANTIAAMDDGLRAFESLCQRAGPRRCALAGHGPVARRVTGLLARVRRSPIPAPNARPAGALRYGDLWLSSPFGGELSVAVPPNRLLRGAFVVV
jgi:hypothetical protein